MTALILNIAGFNVVWFVTVIGAAQGLPVAGLAAYSAFAAWQISASPGRGREIVMTILVAPVGWLIDSAYAYSGLLAYASPWPGPPLAPWWIALLWANFILLVNHGLAPFRHRPALAACLGALGGPAAYLGAEQLGAVAFIDGRLPGVVFLAVTWAAVMPLLFLTNRRVTRFLHKRSKH